MSAQLMVELEKAGAELDRAATRLYNLVMEFDGGTTRNHETGEMVKQPGLGHKWEAAVMVEAVKIYDAAIKAGIRPPGEDIRNAKAAQIVRAEQPELYSDYLRLATEIKALEKWISTKKAAVSAKQSCLSAEKKLVDMPSPRESRRAA